MVSRLRHLSAGSGKPAHRLLQSGRACRTGTELFHRAQDVKIADPMGQVREACSRRLSLALRRRACTVSLLYVRNSVLLYRLSVRSQRATRCAMLDNSDVAYESDGRKRTKEFQR